jgi:hypothetical protein
MANYSVWNVRMRHEWLATPLKKKRIKRRAAKRLGLFDAWKRQGLLNVDAADGEATDGASAEAKGSSESPTPDEEATTQAS